MRRSRRSGSRCFRARARDWASSSMKEEKHTAPGRVGEAADGVLAEDRGKRKLMSVGIRFRPGKRRRDDILERAESQEGGPWLRKLPAWTRLVGVRGELESYGGGVNWRHDMSEMRGGVPARIYGVRGLRCGPGGGTTGTGAGGVPCG